MLNRNNAGLFNLITVANYKDQVFYSKSPYYGRNVIFFDGTDPNLLDVQGWTQWYSNGQCGLGTNGCIKTAETYVTSVYNAIPSTWRTANSAICSGFSRGNFFMAYFIWKYLNVCRYFVSVGSPGMLKSPIGLATTIEMWSYADPISWLKLPGEYSDYSHDFKIVLHWWDTYGNAMVSWSGLSDSVDFSGRLAVWGT
jgi:hypothetical protein